MLFLFWYFSFVTAASYSPYEVACPDYSLTRPSNEISNRERIWVEKRHKKTNKALAAYLNSVGLEYNKSILFGDEPPNIALALSGGGCRALLTGAGELSALDIRSADEGSLGGVLQSSTYLAGLSGGSWIVALLALQGFVPVSEVIYDNPYDIWNLTFTRGIVNMTQAVALGMDIARKDYDDVLTHMNYWNYPDGQGISADLEEKEKAGFNVTVVDVWGRSLAHQYFTRGKNNWFNGVTWSDIQKTDVFTDHEMPFPIVTALVRYPGSLDYSLHSPIVEFNPFETGSFDKSIYTFHDTRYLGSEVNNGIPDGQCVNGFDQASWVYGTSSALFNLFLNTLVCPKCKLNLLLKFVLKRLLVSMSERLQDISILRPNPFKNSKYAASKELTSDDSLYLMDGGLAGEVLPTSNLMVHQRKLDVLFAFDNNGPEFPNGLSLISTYERQFLEEGKSTVCPYVPGESTFGFYNLTTRPTFFGCDAKNQTSLAKDGVIPPIVVYLANRPFEFMSNVSTLKTTFDDHEKKGMVQNGYDIATRMNSTLDENWPTCVGCAMISRAQYREGVEPSDICKKCFAKYCWDGSLYEDPDYVYPGNFDRRGRTNEPMKLWGDNEYIQHKLRKDRLIKKVTKGILRVVNIL